jgi:hypothetical protein
VRSSVAQLLAVGAALRTFDTRVPLWQVSILIFAQAEGARIDVVRLAGNARKFFEAELQVLEQTAMGPEAERVRLRLESKKHGHAGSFILRSRPATADDRFEAEAAEARGRAAGMSLLAAKCGFAWELSPEAGAPESATLNLCAIIASVALGPVMPADRSTLYGVRGSMERVERLIGG